MSDPAAKPGPSGDEVPKSSPEVVVLADDEQEELIDVSSEESFPASDPPSWTLGREPHDGHTTHTPIEDHPAEHQP